MIPRVALVISSLQPGGAERVVCQLAEHWVADGSDVTVVTVGRCDRDAYRLTPAARRVTLDLLRPSRNALEGLFNGSRRVLALRRALVRLLPDAVVSFLESTNVLSLLATRGTGIPVFACVRTDPRYAPIGRAWGALRRLLYPRAAAIVVQTEAVAGWARGLCSHVEVIPNFVQRGPRLASPGVGRGPRRLVAMGRLVPAKGFDLLIEAFARVTSSHPDWSLVILGDGPERAHLEAMISELRLHHRVLMPGRVTDPAPYLTASHVFVLSSRYEGFPNALLEAMACGLPAVAFDCPSGPADIIAHGYNGLLVRAGDVVELAAALDCTMGSASERVRLGQNALEVAVRLAPEPILARWSALLAGGGR